MAELALHPAFRKDAVRQEPPPSSILPHPIRSATPEGLRSAPLRRPEPQNSTVSPGPFRVPRCTSRAGTLTSLHRPTEGADQGRCFRRSSGRARCFRQVSLPSPRFSSVFLRRRWCLIGATDGIPGRSGGNRSWIGGIETLMNRTAPTFSRMINRGRPVLADGLGLPHWLFHFSAAWLREWAAWRAPRTASSARPCTPWPVWSTREPPMPATRLVSRT
jgi:hypothetical protein